MQISEREVSEITESIWSSMLGLSVRAGAIEPAPGSALFSASVRIHGSWNGELTLLCSAAFAYRAAGIMFGLERAATSDEHVQDTLGELANMIGGNVKALLASGALLSLPRFSTGATGLAGAGSSRVCEVPLDCEGERLWVVVSKQGPDCH